MTQKAKSQKAESFSLSSLLKLGNRRAVELRSPGGTRVFRLALTWVVAAGVLLLLTRLFVPALIAAVVLLFLKYQFVFTKEPLNVNAPD